MAQGPIRTAILSYGMSGDIFHAPLLAALPDHFAIKTIVQRKAPSAKERYPATKIVNSVDEAITDDEIELVIVNTPNETHLDFGIRALEAGKHVIVEKPFTVSTKEAQTLIEKAKDRKRILSVFQNRRWDGDFLTIKNILKEGVLGNVVEFEAHYDRFRNYVEPTSWKEEARPGTGILYNLGSHMLDQVVQLFGMPEYVDARIGKRRPGSIVDDYYDIRLEFDNVQAIVKSSYLVKAEMPRYIIHGTQGSFVKYGIDPQEQALKEKRIPGEAGWADEPLSQSGKLVLDVNSTTVEKQVPTVNGNYLEYYRNIYSSIRDNAPLAVTAEEAKDVIRLIEACYESHQQKKAVKLSRDVEG
jgi:scyllo-inositol 2-dehydrogenase (NADP+)